MKMDRRKYLKSIVVGTAGAGILFQSCAKDEKQPVAEPAKDFAIDRTTDELAYERSLLKEKFFDDHEMKTITILGDIIIPKDETSGSASDAKVPEFIEFIVKDMPRHQVPLRGGIKWLDLQCLKRFEADFASCSQEQQIQMVDEIAFPEKAKPEMAPGVAFFNLMRDLTATGFFTSEIGLKDLGYMGNKPNQWDGVPEDVLKQYNIAYDQRTLDISVKHG
jgi:gluconate 2-dehydrogenase gamma chain